MLIVEKVDEVAAMRRRPKRTAQSTLAGVAGVEGQAVQGRRVDAAVFGSRRCRAASRRPVERRRKQFAALEVMCRQARGTAQQRRGTGCAMEQTWRRRGVAPNKRSE